MKQAKVLTGAERKRLLAIIANDIGTCLESPIVARFGSPAARFWGPLVPQEQTFPVVSWKDRC